MAVIKSQFLISLVLCAISLQQVCCDSQDLESSQPIDDVNDIVIETFIVSTKIKYRYSKTRIFCQVKNTHRSEYRELPFVLELPENAFISNFTMEMDGQRYKSFIKDSFEAKRSYNLYREWDRTSAIVAQQGDIFKVLVNVAANKTILFYMEYEEEVVKAASQYTYSLHLVPKANVVKHFCVDVDVLDYQPITVTSVNLSSKDGKVVEVDLQKDAILLHNERNSNAMRVIWEPFKNPAKVQELLETGTIGQFKLAYELRNQDFMNDVIIRNGHFVHRLDLSSVPPLPVHVIFVLDVSGSMIGTRGEQMKAAMRQILRDMNEEDYFHLITFSSSAQVLDDNFQSATALFKRIAINRVSEAEFNGDTNINEALLKGLELANKSHHLFKKYLDVAPKSVLFFLSDGHANTGVLDRLDILQNVQERNTAKVPIYTVGLGKEADHALLETLAAQNHGMHRKIYDDAKVELQVQDFYAMVASPILADLNISYVMNSTLVKVSDISYHRERSQWLTSGTELVVIGRYELIIGNNSKLTDNHLMAFHSEIHGLRPFYKQLHIHHTPDLSTAYKVTMCPCGICGKPGEDYVMKLRQDGNLCTEGDEDKFMHRYWVYKTIKSMIREVIASGNGSIRAEVVRLSKQYHFVTPYTSLLITGPRSVKENRFNYSPSPVPQISPLKEDPLSRRAVVMHAVPDNFVNYSSQRNSQTPQQNSSLLDAMRQEHMLTHSRNVTPDGATPQNTQTFDVSAPRSSALRIVLDLDDITWLRNNTDKILRLRYRSHSIRPYKILEVPEEHMTLINHPRCRSNQTFVQQCTHLVNCVSANFINSFRTFVLSYFCPIAVPDGTFYTGTCCPM